MTRIYTLHPNLHYEIYTGICANGLQALLGEDDRNIIIIFFDLEGNLTNVTETLISVEPLPPKESLQQFSLTLQKVIEELGLQLQPIRVKEFFLKEHQIGIEPLSEELAEYQQNPSKFAGDTTDWQAMLDRWIEAGDFVFFWGNDFWADEYGIHSS